MRWNIKNKLINTADRHTEIIEKILQNRQIQNPKGFFSPPSPKEITLKQTGIDPQQADKAIHRLKQAIKNQEQIIVYGDYDADGVTATAIMWETLQELAKAKLSKKLSFNPSKIMPHIPDRFTEGYGMKIETIKHLQQQYPQLKLIITVDTGITAHQAIDYCNSQKIDVIITDHHQPDKTNPDAYATIHTTQTSGSAVAWWFCQYLKAKLSIESLALNQYNHLDLATIGTVADLLPLTGINRSLITHGLPQLQQTNRPGLKNLFQTANITPSSISTYHIGFLISPRLNAMGRLTHALDSLRLLCTTDENRARHLAQTLHTTNQDRQQLTQEMTEHAFKLVNKFPQDQKIIIVGDSEYPEGIIGLIAGKLVEKFHKPAIVFSQDKTHSKASARSIKNYNIIEAIRTANNLITSGGGHPMAAGLTLDNHNYTKFEQQMINHANQNISQTDLTPQIDIDLEIQLTDINRKLYNQIQQLSPFGIGNPQPVFASTQIQLVNFRTVGKQDKHLKLEISNQKQKFSAIAFNLGHLYSQFQTGQAIDIAYQISLNSWQGRETLELNIKDINLANG